MNGKVNERMNGKKYFGVLSRRVPGVFAVGLGLLCGAGAAATESMPFGFDGPLTEAMVLNLKPAEVLPVKAGTKRLDAWWETFLNFGTATEGGDIRNTPHWRKDWLKLRELMPLVNDPAKNPVGDFAVVFDAERAAAGTRAVGVHPGPFLQPWKLDADWTLQLWLKGEGLEDAPTLVLVDGQGKRAVGELAGFAPDGQWHEITVALSALQAGEGFDFGTVRAVQFEQDWPETARLGMDGVRFLKGELEIGITDKSLDQRIDEARRTRLLRMHESIVNSGIMTGAPKKRQDPGTVNLAPYALWPRAGLDLADANRQIANNLAAAIEAKRADTGGAIVPPSGPVLYWTFGSRSPIFPGRLSPEAETLLEQWLWQSSEVDNDIHNARLPSLWVFSSENHDSSWRVRGLLSSGIFKDLPGYMDREHPDHGYGPGFPGYGYPPTDLEELRGYFPHRGEFGPLSDGKRYHPPEHYQAWKDLWHRYFTDRAKNNFFLEQGGGYRGALLRAVYAVYLYSRDPELTERASMFLDFFWLKYAQNSLSGYEGGPKHRQAPGEYFDSRHDPFVTFQLGGPATGQSTWYWRMPAVEMLTGDYELPRIAWRMMLDKKGMGSYVFEARGVGEENDIDQRPEGTQNMFMLDGQQRMVRYRYNTPYYMLSSSLDSPKMTYGHLTRSQLWQGLIAPWSDAILCPIAPDDETGNRVRSIAMPIHGVQDRNVFVGYYDPLTRVRSPEWFPAWDRRAFVPDEVGDEIYWATRGWKLRVFQSSAEMLVRGWDEVVEQGGWVFAKAGPVYAAARIVVPEYNEKGNPVRDPDVPNKLKLRTEDVYTWNENRTIFGASSSDVMIIEAGSADDYSSFDAFRAAILANKLEVYMVRLAPILIYRGARADAREIILNLEHPYVYPKLDGEPINYELPWTVKTPYMESEYRSGVIRAEYGGESLLLDFDRLTRNPER